jgi:DNA (cytosine-5)-methyltransferase 1
MININNTKTITFGSLFSGIGGLDLGLEQAGMKCVFQVENDKHCLTILNRHWPDVPKNEIRPCMGLVGGDPCPIRSNASFISCKGTVMPDMSGYFLAMAARIKPGWILRENVPAPDSKDFSCALEYIGYRSIIITMDSKAFTGQSRTREFVAGFNKPRLFDRFVGKCSEQQGNKRFGKKNGYEETPLPCFNTRRFRLDACDTMVYENERGLRLLSHAERESLQGFTAGWTDGIPQSARERTVGNAVTVPVAKWLGERIKEAINQR